MDRRSWLWRKKSSEKSPGENESSGSISSLSERFSDDQVYATHNSPEVASKPAPNDEENETVKNLKEKLSWAIRNISAKEDLVKQHAKVAEEAVAGWEAAENEVLGLKQQLEAATRKSSSLEDRAGHLDGALKECVRQLRQAREDQEQKINEAISKKAYEYESTKFELENQIMQLQAKLEAAEKANSSLEQELLTKRIETELCTQAAEAASKQHLEDMRKVARLEAECKRLKVIAHEASATTVGPSSVYVESFTDSQSDCGERLFAGRNSFPHSIEIGLMDDFLEMERLAALPDTESESCYLEASPVSDQRTSCERSLRAELEAMIHRTGEMEERLEKMGEEKEEVEASLRELQAQLAHTHESKVSAEEQLVIVKAEIDNLHSRIASLEEELQKERDFSTHNLAKCEGLEAELEKERASASESLAKCSKWEAEALEGAKLHQEKELAVAASKLLDCQKTIASLGRQLKSLATLEDLLWMDEKSEETSPKNGVDPSRDSASPPENGNDKELLLPVSINLVSEKIIPRGRSRFRKEISRD